jgi:hypothetical protein
VIRFAAESEYLPLALSFVAGSLGTWGIRVDSVDHEVLRGFLAEYAVPLVS